MIEWTWPTEYDWLSGYDWKTPVNYISSLGTKEHAGIDIRAPLGAKILAPVGASVLSATLGTAANNYNSGYGNLIILETSTGYKIYLAHLSKMMVSAGETVKPGQVIGQAGNTGNSEGPHLHFEIRKNNRPVDPWDFYPDEVQAGEPSDYLGPAGRRGAPGSPPGQRPAPAPADGETGLTSEPVGFLEYEYNLDLGTILGKDIEFTFTVNWGNVVSVFVGLILVLVGTYGLVQVAGKTATKEVISAAIPGGGALVEAVG